ncbi:hypothetical protein MHYP_G00072250 [Metynnis hypsauchen]
MASLGPDLRSAQQPGGLWQTRLKHQESFLNGSSYVTVLKGQSDPHFGPNMPRQDMVSAFIGLKNAINQVTSAKASRTGQVTVVHETTDLGGLCHNLATPGGAGAHSTSSRNLAATLSEWEPKIPANPAVLQHKG